MPLLADLFSACGDDPRFVCEVVYDLTDSEVLAEVADFLMRPLRVILILAAAWLINRIVRRIIDRTVGQVVAAQEEKAAAAASEQTDDDSATPLDTRRDVAALANRIIELGRDAALRVRLGNAGRARVEDSFDLSTQTDRFVAFFEHAVERRRARE